MKRRQSRPARQWHEKASRNIPSSRRGIPGSGKIKSAGGVPGVKEHWPEQKENIPDDAVPHLSATTLLTSPASCTALHTPLHLSPHCTSALCLPDSSGGISLGWRGGAASCPPAPLPLIPAQRSVLCRLPSHLGFFLTGSPLLLPAFCTAPSHCTHLSLLYSPHFSHRRKGGGDCVAVGVWKPTPGSHTLPPLEAGQASLKMGLGILGGWRAPGGRWCE